MTYFILELIVSLNVKTYITYDYFLVPLKKKNIFCHVLMLRYFQEKSSISKHFCILWYY